MTIRVALPAAGNIVIIAVLVPLTAGNWIVAFGFVRLMLLPKLFTPVNVWGLALSNATFALRRESDSAPEEICDASNPVKLAPGPAKAVAVTVPFTSIAEAGFVLLMPTPPRARIRN